MQPWYDDLAAMRADDRHLQRVYRRLRRRLRASGACAQSTAALRHVHVYPSKTCTYTINKRRIFVRMRDAAGAAFPDCVLHHVLLHEVAHVLNDHVGHTDAFRRILDGLSECTDDRCRHDVPADFNPCQ